MSIAPRLLALSALVLAASTSIAHAAVSQTISAGIDQNQELMMSFADGTPIGSPSPPGTLIPPGSYQVAVNDGSDIGNVDLNGPGVSDATGVDTLIRLTWNVTLQPCSIYSYTDDTVATSTQWFQTSASTASTAPCASAPEAAPAVPTSNTPSGSGTSATTPAKKKIAPLVDCGTLAARVSRSGALSLTLAGKAVNSLRSGRYAISVVDDSRGAGFTIQEIRSSAITITTTTFVGKRTRTVALPAGQWLFYPSFIGKKTYFVITTSQAT